MNRRRIRKQLHRQRSHSNFWGRRGYLTIRFPISVIPPKPDTSVFDGYGPEVDSLCYQREIAAPGGTKVFMMSQDIRSCGYPCEDDRIIFDVVTETTEYGNSYTWSEIRHFWIPKDQTRCKRMLLPVPREHVQRMSEYNAWTNLVQGSYLVKELPELLQVLVGYCDAKTHYVNTTKDYYEFTYSVKPWYVKSFVTRDCNRILNALDRMVAAGTLPWYKVMR